MEMKDKGKQKIYYFFDKNKRKNDHHGKREKKNDFIEKQIFELKEYFYVVSFAVIEKFHENPRNGKHFAGDRRIPS
jgi:hypothetical protein